MTLKNNITYILYLTQLFKTANSGTISQYFIYYCSNIGLIAMPMHTRKRIRNAHDIRIYSD